MERDARFKENLISLFIVLLGFLFSSCSLSGKISGLDNSSSNSNNSITLSAVDKIVVEYGVATMTVHLSKVQTSDITFNYYTQDTTAINGTDYNSVSGSATIPAGQTSITLSIPIIDNQIKSANKKFMLHFSNVSSSDISLVSAVIEIQDDDYDVVTYFQNSISVNADHACAVTSSGGAKCWGRNMVGKLGDGTTTNRSIPVDVSGLSSGVTSIAAGGGYNFSCAVASGGAKCWGSNGSGQLGDGTTTNSYTPVTVSGLSSGVASISSGNSHTCVVTTGGGAKCWGGGLNGQLGDSLSTSSTVPVDVSTLGSGVASISAGSSHTCAVTTGGGAKCWGYNNTGQLGDNSTTTRNAPVDVSGHTSGVAKISAGLQNHSCLVTIAGAARCWGYNMNGQLGDNSTTQRLTSVGVSGLSSGVAEISAGTTHTCALTTSGSVKCWGNNSSGQLGDGTTTQRLTPVDVQGLTSGVTAISAGQNFTCALLSSGIIKCWGANSYGQIGNNLTTSRTIASDVFGMSSGVASVALGQSHSCAITTSGGAKCWGDNTYGYIGDGTTINRFTPVDVSGLTSGVASISAGRAHTCVITTSGGAKCWGSGGNGQLGDNTSTQRNSPVDVFGLTSGAAVISAGNSHTCAVTTSGGAKCWGYNASGQVGDNSTTQRAAPVDVVGLTSGVASVMVGESHSCALTTAGGVKCWGQNTYGQLGDNSTTQRNTPVDVVGLTSGVAEISIAYQHNCARMIAGGFKCWGYNYNGQLGDGTTTDRLVPVDVVMAPGNTTSIFVGYDYTCVRTSTGEAKCWGRGAEGQLGDGTFTTRTTIGDVLGLSSGVTSFALPRMGTGYHACAILSTGGLKCWGNNGSGQLGINYDTLTPQSVVSP